MGIPIGRRAIIPGGGIPGGIPIGLCICGGGIAIIAGIDGGPGMPGSVIRGGGPASGGGIAIPAFGGATEKGLDAILPA